VFARKSKVVAREVEAHGRKAATRRDSTETGITLMVLIQLPTVDSKI